MTTPATPAADAVSLHNLCMNIQTAPSVEAMGDADRLMYKSGHRDARHAAAELALARESALVAERDAYKDRLFAAIEGDEILARALEMVNGTDRISPMQMSELLDVASANLARARAVEAERDALRAHLAMWCHDGALQTFESREKFRKESRALAAPAVEGV